METTWVLVANRAGARIFEKQKGWELRELRTLTHPEARLHERDLLADEHGRAFDSAGQGRHAMGTSVSAKEHEAETFARAIGDDLENARARSEFAHLVVVAEPSFLGLLHGQLSDETRKCVQEELRKDLVRFAAPDIEKHLAEMH